MTDITTHNDTQQRLRRILDEETITPRATDHEIAPQIVAPTPTGGQLMAETLIGHSDTATNLVLDALDRWEAKIGEIREIVQKSKLQAHDAIRAHMLISETAMKGVEQIGQQLMDAVNMLAALNGARHEAR